MLLLIIHLQQLLGGVAEISLLLKERGKTLSQHFLRDLGSVVADELHAAPSLCDWVYKLCESEHLAWMLSSPSDWLRNANFIFDFRHGDACRRAEFTQRCRFSKTLMNQMQIHTQRGKTM